MSYNLKYHKSRYCKEPENIENYEKAKADNFKGWCIHHRKEAEFSRKELIALGMYWHRPASELIFMKESEHTQLHKKGKHLSAEHKNKMSEAMKGKYAGENHPMYGKKHSDEARKKMRESHKGKHIGNTATKGMRWYNNGKISKRAFECPDGFTPGHLLK